MRPKNVYLYPDEMKTLQTRLISENKYFIDSINSVYCPYENAHYYDISACREWADLNGEMILMTPGLAARTELRRYYPDCNLIWHKSEFKLLDIQPPHFWTGVPYFGYLYHFDLKGAYGQIYRKLTVDVVSPRGQGQMYLKPIHDRLENWKVARNSLVGIMRSHTLTAWNKGKWNTVKYHNAYFNPHLWYTIQVILHSIARKAVNLGGIYVSTDGYFLVDPRKATRFREYLDTFGLSYHYFEGEGDVTGWGSYQIPSKKTKRRIITKRPLNNLSKEDSKGGTITWWAKLK